MGQVGYATLAVVPSLKDFGKQLSSGIGPELDRAGKDGGKRFGSGLSSTAKSVGMGAGILMGGALVSAVGAAIGGVGAIIKTGFDESKNASAGMAQLAAGIKSTGNAAGVTVPGMDALAKKIQAYSGQTDDSIVQTEALLLTFPKIKNAGLDKIFDKTTIAAADMAARMGGSASDSAIRLGRALSDPVKGVGALTRVGVVFTAAQKDSIAAMVKTGDVAGAQSVILKELQTEFGGSAKAAGQSLPGQMAIAKRSFEELSETVVTGLLPAFTTGLTGINTFVNGVKASFTAGGISKVFTDIGANIAAALPGIQAQLMVMGTALWAWVQVAVPPMLVKLGELLLQLGTWLVTVAYPAIAAQLVSWGKAFVEWITPMIPPFLAKLGDLMVQFGNWMLNTALPAIGAHLLEWGTAFVKWIAPMIPPVLLALGELLLKLGGWILTVALPAILGQLGQWALAFAKWIPGAIVNMLTALIPMLGQLGTWIVSTAAPQLVTKLMEWSKAFASWIARAIIEAPGKLLGLLGAIITWAASVGPKILSTLGDLSGLLRDAGMSIIRGLLDGIMAKFEDLKNFVGGIGSWIADHKGPLSYDRALLVPHGNALMAGLNEGIMSGFGQVQSNVSGMNTSISGLMTNSGSMDFASPNAIASAVGGSGGSSAPIEITVISQLDGVQVGRSMVKYTKDQVKRNGLSGLA